MAGMDIGIDLGTANVLVVVDDKGVVLNEPAVVAVDNRMDEIIAVGHEAYKMIGRTPKDIEAIRPMMNGVISDYDNAEKMLRGFINMLGESKGMGKIVMPRIMVSVPSKITDVERKAVQDATKQAGAREVLLIEEPIAAAIGAGIDITVPGGHLVVDIGGGTTDVAVISLGGTIAVLGVEKIIYFATPIYKGVYPSLIVLMILGIFRKFIPNKQSFRYALIFTLAVSILEAILSVADVAIIKAFVDILPFSGLGFAWFLPATLGFIIGAVRGKEPLTQFE